MKNKSKLIWIIDDSIGLSRDRIIILEKNYPSIKTQEGFVDRNKKYQNKFICYSNKNNLGKNYSNLNRKY